MPRFTFPMALGLAACAAFACSTSVEGNRSGSPDATPAVNTGFPDASPVVVPDAEPQIQPCVEGDKQVTDADGTCYMMLNTIATWTQAQAACITLGATLVVIESLEEQTLVATLAAQFPLGQPDIWIGATDVATEGAYLWVTQQQPLTYTKWRSGEPNNNGPNGLPENCMLMEGDNPAAEWDDRICTELFPAICER